MHRDEQRLRYRASFRVHPIHVIHMTQVIHLVRMVYEGPMPCYPEAGFLSITDQPYKPVQNMLYFYTIELFTDNP